MSAVIIGLYFYLVIGAIIATALDRHLMRKDVPYGDFPSFPLVYLRTTCIVTITCFWPVVIFGAVQGITEAIQDHIRIVRRARRIYGHRR